MRSPATHFLLVTLLAGVTFVISGGRFSLWPQAYVSSNRSTAAVARPWDEITEAGRLRVGVKDNLPPLAWQTPNSTTSDLTWQGFEIEIVRELARRLLGNADAVTFVPLHNRDRLNAAIEDRVDFAIGQIGITADRLRLVSLTEPYYLDGTTVVVANDAPLQSTLDLTTQTIAVLEGSTAVATLNTMAPELILVAVSSYQEGVEALQHDRVDGFAADASVMTGWLLENPDYRLLDPLLAGSGLAIALPKGNQYSELRRQVHLHMQALSESGWFEERARAWGLP